MLVIMSFALHIIIIPFFVPLVACPPFRWTSLLNQQHRNNITYAHINTIHNEIIAIKGISFEFIQIIPLGCRILLLQFVTSIDAMDIN